MARSTLKTQEADNFENAPAPVEESTAGGGTMWAENSKPDVVLFLAGMPSGHDSVIEASSPTHVWRGPFHVFLKQFNRV